MSLIFAVAFWSVVFAVLEGANKWRSRKSTTGLFVNDCWVNIEVDSVVAFVVATEQTPRQG